MSEERTRFPIQPKDRHRTAGSSRDISNEPEAIPDDAIPGNTGPAQRAPDQDKPQVPPAERHDR